MSTIKSTITLKNGKMLLQWIGKSSSKNVKVSRDAKQSR